MIGAAREIEPYDYQAEGLEKLRENIRRHRAEQPVNLDGLRRETAQVLNAPCGAGKTIMALLLVQECVAKGNRVLFVCDRRELVKQVSQEMDRFGIEHGIIMAEHSRRRPWLPVQVCSAQTLERRADWPPCDLIVIDECHTMRRAVLKRIGVRDADVVGLSATPFSRGMGKHYDGVVSVSTNNALTAKGRLVPFVVYAPSEPDMTGAKTTAGEWTLDEAEKRSLPIIGDAVREYNRHGEDRKFLAYGVTIRHCEELHEQFMSAGVQTRLYTANTPEEERDEIMREFRKPDSFIKGLISVAALSRGLDVPDVSAIIMCRPLKKSLAEHLQILGRGLRSHPGKENCLILDHSSNMLRFWPEMADYFENGLDELDDGKSKPKKKAKAKDASEPVKCPQCSHIHPPRPRCPMCDYEYPRRRSDIRHQAGELTELVGSGVAPGNERQELFSQLIAIQQEKRRKFTWARCSFKERVGSWPDGLAPVPTEPTMAVRRWAKSRDIAYAKRRSAA